MGFAGACACTCVCVVHLCSDATEIQQAQVCVKGCVRVLCAETLFLFVCTFVYACGSRRTCVFEPRGIVDALPFTLDSDESIDFGRSRESSIFRPLRSESFASSVQFL